MAKKKKVKMEIPTEFNNFEKKKPRKNKPMGIPDMSILRKEIEEKTKRNRRGTE
jgi:hypothetical protein